VKCVFREQSSDCVLGSLTVAVYQLHSELESEAAALEIGVTAVQLGNLS